jgi:hypothetical protein
MKTCTRVHCCMLLITSYTTVSSRVPARWLYSLRCADYLHGCAVPWLVLWLSYLHQQLLCIKREGSDVHGSGVGCQHTAPLKHTVPCSTRHKRGSHSVQCWRVCAR